MFKEYRELYGDEEMPKWLDIISDIFAYLIATPIILYLFLRRKL